MKRGTILALTLAGVGLAVLSFARSRPALVWNASASAPIGLYQLQDRPWTRGDRVAVRPDAALALDLDRRHVLPEGRLLLKRVAAINGDTVCRRGPAVTINGETAALARDLGRSGDPLPVWDGCRTLASNEVFLLGDTAMSYDGRYFGVTRAGAVLGPVRRVIPWGD
jgi:type IV secretory pathway protease TraF